MNRFVIKICGVTTPEDALSAVDCGANALGFNFYPRSPRFISLSQARSIAFAVPDGIDKVGVFVSPSAEELRAAVEAAGLNVLQIHGDWPAQTSCPWSLRLWRALPATANLALADDPSIEAVLLDSPTPLHGGSGRTFDWSLAARPSKARIILAGGLDASNVAAAIAAARPWGVDACSGLESAPGRKDQQKMKAFVEAARSGFEGLGRLTTPAAGSGSELLKETV